MIKSKKTPNRQHHEDQTRIDYSSSDNTFDDAGSLGAGEWIDLDSHVLRFESEHHSEMAVPQANDEVSNQGYNTEV